MCRFWDLRAQGLWFRMQGVQSPNLGTEPLGRKLVPGEIESRASGLSFRSSKP